VVLVKLFLSISCFDTFKQEREGKQNSQLLSTTTNLDCFEDPAVKYCMIEQRLLLAIPNSYFFILDGGIVHWRFVKVLGSL